MLHSSTTHIPTPPPRPSPYSFDDMSEKLTTLNIDPDLVSEESESDNEDLNIFETDKAAAAIAAAAHIAAEDSVSVKQLYSPSSSARARPSSLSAQKAKAYNKSNTTGSRSGSTRRRVEDGSHTTNPRKRKVIEDDSYSDEEDDEFDYDALYEGHDELERAYDVSKDVVGRAKVLMADFKVYLQCAAEGRPVATKMRSLGKAVVALSILVREADRGMDASHAARSAQSHVEAIRKRVRVAGVTRCCPPIRLAL